MTNELDIFGQNALTRPGAAHIIVILDRSGSMAGQEADVIGGFNSIVRHCRDAQVDDCDVTYVRFDDRIEHVFTLGLADVPEMTAALYAPRGSTALIDAVGRTVSPIDNHPDDTYIVITYTDGQENASREWTREKLRALLEARKALGNWTFAFFGADIDAWGEAGGMGYDAGNTRSIDKRRMRDYMDATGRSTAMMAKHRIRRSDHLAEAVDTVLADAAISDDELARRLSEEPSE
ncbi:MAG TPA: vWA domain-containing protein [Dehalococcoidia bacterium]|nr:vWA domain-containing protein [Dehalococcoidia bacterium]